MLKRNKLAVSLLSLAALPAMSQSAVLSNPGNHARWGIRASLDISVPGKINGAKVYHNDVGFSAGVVYQLPLVANLYFEPGLGLFYDTFNFGKLTISDGTADGYGYETTPKYSQFGLRVPLTFGYRFDLWENGGVSILTGPELSVGLSGRIHGKYLDDIDDLSLDMYDDDNGFRRFNLLWGVGASIDAGSFTIGAVYDFGLLNTRKEKLPLNPSLSYSGSSFRQNVARVYIGYNF